MYLYIEDNKIKEAFCGDIPENLKDKELIEISDDIDIRYDIPLSWYDDEWKIKPIQTLIEDGLYILSPYEKIVNGSIIEKTEVELISEGIKEMPIGKKMAEDGLSLIDMTSEEKYNAGIYSLEKYSSIIRNKRDTLIQEILWRVERYQTQTALGITPNDSETMYIKILQYIQALRDITTQNTFPIVVWPVLEDN